MSRTTENDDLEALRRRAADAAAAGRDDERVRALVDLARALWRNSPDGDLQARRPHLDEAIEALATAHQVQAAADPAPDAAWRADVTLRLAVLLTLRNTADGDPTEQNTIVDLLREVVSGGVLPADRAEVARLLLGIVLVQGIFLPFRGADPGGMLKIAMHVLTTGPQGFQEAVGLLGRVEESRLPDTLKPLPVLLKLLLMYCRVLLDGRTGGLNLSQIKTMLKTARSFLDELSGGSETAPMLRRMADDMRALTGGLELRLTADPARADEAIRELEEARETPSPVSRGLILHELALAYSIRGNMSASSDDIARARESLTRALDDIDPAGPLAASVPGLLAALEFTKATLDPTPEAVASAVQVARRLPVPEGAPENAQEAWDAALLGAALSMQARHGGDTAALEEAERRLTSALPFLVDEAPLAGVVLPALGAVLSQRGFGGLADLQIGRDLMVKGVEVEARLGGSKPPAMRPLSPVTRASRGLLLAFHRGDGDDPDATLPEAVAELTTALDELPPSYAHRPLFTLGLGIARTLLALHRDSAADARRAADLLAAGADGTEGPFATVSRVIEGLGCLFAAVREEDPSMYDRAVASLDEALHSPYTSYADRSALLRTAGWARLLRARSGGRDGDLDRSVRLLEEARSLTAGRPLWLQGTDLLVYLSEAYRARGETGLAVETGMEALRAFAAEVLLQTTPDHGLSAARGAAAHTRLLADWCLAEDRPDAAVEALELGRGLVLYAATVAADVPSLLDARDRRDLAEEWRRADGPDPRSSFPGLLHAPGRRRTAAPGDFMSGFSLVSDQVLGELLGGLDGKSLPTDLRHRVLQVLIDSPEEAAILAPPGTAEIGEALTVASMDALVYLLHGTGESTGTALVVWADGTTDAIPLPGLEPESSAPLHDHAEKAAEDERSLENLCDWAWEAAMGPLLALCTRRRGLATGPPRVVLVPCGMLGIVPWHAARTGADTGGRPRYACQELVITYSATARQFVDGATGRDPADGPGPLKGSPHLIGNPRGDLLYASKEVGAIAAAFYKNAVVLGRPTTRTQGHATVEAVLDALPGSGNAGVPLLHMALHGVTRFPPTRSALSLYVPRSATAEDAGELRIGTILDQARKQSPGTRRGCVVLSACRSDLALHDHDEALTLATAFVAAGAGSVVGSRWRVGDGAALAILMFMFHHFMAALGQSPVDALRSAQLWMLDPGRAVPDTMPEELAGEVAVADDDALTGIAVWGAFAHHGA